MHIHLASPLPCVRFSQVFFVFSCFLMRGDTFMTQNPLTWLRKITFKDGNGFACYLNREPLQN